MSTPAAGQELFEHRTNLVSISAHRWAVILVVVAVIVVVTFVELVLLVGKPAPDHSFVEQLDEAFQIS